LRNRNANMEDLLNDIKRLKGGIEIVELFFEAELSLGLVFNP